MDRSEIESFRRQKDEFFRSHPHSPLPEAERSSFPGLDYYPPNPDLVFTVPVEPIERTTLQVSTSDGQTREFVRAGRVRFAVDGKPAELTLLASAGHPGYFLPFRDATSGKDTYGAGRYLDLEEDRPGVVTIDFNYAYNPTCAYSEEYSCPLPPPENWLQVPIRAGERDYDHP